MARNAEGGLTWCFNEPGALMQVYNEELEPWRRATAGSASARVLRSCAPEWQEDLGCHDASMVVFVGDIVKTHIA
eukprot:11225922-Lingulodinium_polyedra.AAC.1